MLARLRGPLMLALVLIAALTLRLTHLEGDPPRLISGGPSPNEGYYILNAVNWAREGHWRLDEWDSLILNPVASALSGAVFRAAGTGLTQSRLLTVTLSMAALILYYGLLAEACGAGTALLATFLMGLNGVFLVYSRLANPAPIAILLMLVTILLWRLGARYRVLVPVAGAFLVLAAVVENGPRNIFFVVTAVLALLMIRLQAWKMPWSRSTRSRIRWFWLTALAAFVVWLLVAVLPHRESYVRMLNTPLAVARLGNVPQNLFMAPFIFWHIIRWMPVTWLIVLAYFLVFARSLFAPIARHRPLSETRVWFFAWLVTAPLFVAIRDDRPLSVMVLLVPPFCMAAAEAMTQLLGLRQLRKPAMDIMVVLGLLTLVTWFTVQAAVHGAVVLGYRSLPPQFFRHEFRYELLVVVLIAAPLTWLVSHLWLRWKKFALDLSPGRVNALFGVLFLGVVAFDAAAAMAVMRTPAGVHGAARALASLPRGSVVAGTWSPILSVEGGWRGVVIWPGMNDRLPPGELGITHLLLQRDSSEDLRQNRIYRSMIAGRPEPPPLLMSLGLGMLVLDFYSLTPAASP